MAAIVVARGRTERRRGRDMKGTDTIEGCSQIKDRGVSDAALAPWSGAFHSMHVPRVRAAHPFLSTLRSFRTWLEGTCTEAFAMLLSCRLPESRCRPNPDHRASRVLNSLSGLVNGRLLQSDRTRVPISAQADTNGPPAGT